MSEQLNLRSINGLWMIIHGKVYNVNEFKDHPGGYEIFLANKSKDASEEFEKAGHPDYVLKDMKKYLVGEVPIIPQSEVMKHNKEDDMWMAIEGKVYDVSKFKEHPGGYEILEDHSGKDSTKAFDDIGHSLQAKRDLETYYIGQYFQDVPVEVKKSNSLYIVFVVFVVLGIILAYMWT